MVRATGKLKLTVTAAMVVAALCVPTAQAAPKYKVLHAFTGSDGIGPYSGVIVGQDGNLYGTTVGGGAGGCCGTVFELRRKADEKWSESVLYTFENNGRDGDAPYGSLVFNAAGNLYGTTSSGGTHFSGVAFKLTHTAGRWEEAVLYDFCSRQNCSDGGSSTAGLVIDKAGTLYGTAHLVFELSHESGGWKEKVLHHFTGQPGDSTLIFDSSGNLYGATEAGGSSKAGAVFEVQHTSSGWKEQALHNFPAFAQDGQVPGSGALVFDTSGNLYGTTIQGGTNTCADVGCGTIFRLTLGSRDRWKETILYNFQPGASGSFPTAGVVMDKAGNLYGTTDDGGTASCSCGVVYKLAPGSNGKWTYTVLHRFSGIDGAIPAGNLTLDDQGNLYGGTVLGGPVNDGVIFELTP